MPHLLDMIWPCGVDRCLFSQRAGLHAARLAYGMHINHWLVVLQLVHHFICLLTGAGSTTSMAPMAHGRVAARRRLQHSAERCSPAPRTSRCGEMASRPAGELCTLLGSRRRHAHSALYLASDASAGSACKGKPARRPLQHACCVSLFCCNASSRRF